MTLREELEYIANEMESDLGMPDTYRGYFLAKLVQVERDVWEKAAMLEERIRLSPEEMLRLYSDDPAHAIAATCCRFAELCRKQKEAL